MNAYQQSLVVENLDLVDLVVCCYFPLDDNTRDELYAAGQEGLVAAALKFDPERGEFRKYASQPVWRHVRRAYAFIVEKRPLATSVVEKGLDGPLETRDDAAETPYNVAERADMLKHVMGALEGLDGRQRAVLEGHYFQGRKDADIAAELGVSRGRVVQIRKQAIATLHGRLV